MTDEVTLVREGHVAQVTINRPKVLNAVDDKTTARLEEIWTAIEADPEVRVVVITGAGERSFCAGADLSAGNDSKVGVAAWAGFGENGFGGLSVRTTLDIPVIARVNGYALGGGMEIVLGCDLVIAAEHAQFGLTEPRVGAVPCAGGAVQLVRKVPYTQAMGLLLTGRRVTAAEMYRIGLANEVVPANELDNAVDRWVGEVLRCAPSSLRAIKQIVRHCADMSAQQANALRLPALMAALDSEDSKEGRLAFQQKRPPVWPER
jgi:crotonobetainyl-CoA hydratase